MSELKLSIDEITAISKNTLIDTLGIEYIELKEGFMKAKMPVDERTMQPYKILHGGASIVLAETLASAGSVAIVDTGKYEVRGYSVNANHIRAVSGGFVFGKARLVHKGSITHIWDVDICDEKERKVSVVRVTVMIISKK